MQVYYTSIINWYAILCKINNLILNKSCQLIIAREYLHRFVPDVQSLWIVYVDFVLYALHNKIFELNVNGKFTMG